MTARGLRLVALSAILGASTLLLSEKGFYGMAYALALFGSVAVQKNTRDLMAADAAQGLPPLPRE